MDPEPDILPTERCCTDTAGGKAEELVSPPMTHMVFLIKKLDGAFPTVHSHYSSS